MTLLELLTLWFIVAIPVALVVGRVLRELGEAA